MPSSDIQRLAAAVVLALGVGGGGASMLRREDPAALEALLDERAKFAKATYAAKADLAEMTTELALVRQELQNVSAKLVEMSQQLNELHQQPPPRGRR